MGYITLLRYCSAIHIYVYNDVDYTIGTPAKCNLDCCNVCKNVTILIFVANKFRKCVTLQMH